MDILEASNGIFIILEFLRNFSHFEGFNGILEVEGILLMLEILGIFMSFWRLLFLWGCKGLKIISTPKRVFFLVNEKLFQFDQFFQLPQTPKNEENVLLKIFVGPIFRKEDKLSLSNSNLK